MESWQASFECYMGDVEIISNASHTIQSQDQFKKWMEHFKKMNPFNNYTYIMIETYVFNFELNKFIEVRSIATTIVSTLPSIHLPNATPMRIKFVFRLSPHYQKIIDAKYGKSSVSTDDKAALKLSSKAKQSAEVIDISSDSSSNFPKKRSNLNGSKLQRDSNGKRVFAPAGVNTNGESHMDSNLSTKDYDDDDEDSDYERVQRKKKKVKGPTTIVEDVTFLEAVQGGDLEVVEEFLNEGEDINQQDEVCFFLVIH